MKKYLIGAVALFLSTSLVFTACNKENTMSESNNDNSTHYSELYNTELYKIAEIDESNNVVQLFDNGDVVDLVLSYGDFHNINPELTYIKSEQQAFLTIIMQDNKEVSHAIQFRLSVIDNDIFFPNPIDEDGNIDANFAAKHTCEGAPCSSCSFDRNLFGIGWIKGCKCNDSGVNTGCNHTVSSDGNLVDHGIKLGTFIISIIAIFS